MTSQGPLRKHPLYGVYAGMKARVKRGRYGGGVEVCREWMLPGGEGFRRFLRDMGPRPEGETEEGLPLYRLERKDRSIGYEPLNCVWASTEDMRVKCLDCGKEATAGKGRCRRCEWFFRRYGVGRPKREDDREEIRKAHRMVGVRVVQKERDGTVVWVWRDAAQAVAKYGAGVYGAVWGVTDTAYGYLWEYESGITLQPRLPEE